MAIPYHLTNKARMGVPNVTYWRAYLDSYIEVPMHCPKEEQVKVVKKTINLIGKDDCDAAVFHYLYRILRNHHPRRHVLRVTIMEWNRYDRLGKKEVIEQAFDAYPDLWRITVEQPNDQLVHVTFSYPGLEYLVYG